MSPVHTFAHESCRDVYTIVVMVRQIVTLADQNCYRKSRDIFAKIWIISSWTLCGMAHCEYKIN